VFQFLVVAVHFELLLEKAVIEKSTSIAVWAEQINFAVDHTKLIAVLGDGLDPSTAHLLVSLISEVIASLAHSIDRTCQKETRAGRPHAPDRMTTCALAG